MGWACEAAPGGFRLRSTPVFSDPPGQPLREITFRDEADSHEAGEAVREFLGKPRVRDLVAAKERAEAEALQLRTERQRQVAAVAAAEEKALALETGHPERLGIAKELMEVRIENGKLRERIRDLLAPVPVDTKPGPTVEELQEQVRELTESLKALRAETAAPQ